MKSKRSLLLWGLVCLIVICVSLVDVFVQIRPRTDLALSFLDVGQGDAILIETPQRKHVLIDAGPKDVVMDKLRDVMPRGDTHIDMIVVTNPDADHISGFTTVLDEYTVGTVLVPNTRSTTSTYKTLMQKIKDHHIPILVAYADMVIDIDHDDSRQYVLLSVLFPDQVVKNWERNNGSIVTRLTYGDASAMLMGDATSETEKIIIDDFTVKHALGQLKSDIVKLGHHGSRTSSSDEWLDVVAPQIAIVSAGSNNRYGHPHQEVIDRLHDRGIDIQETKNGTITYTSDGGGWKEKE